MDKASNIPTRKIPANKQSQNQGSRSNNGKIRYHKIQINHKSPVEITEPANFVETTELKVNSNCVCCSTSLLYPKSAIRMKCLKCHTHQWIISNPNYSLQPQIKSPISYYKLKRAITHSTDPNLKQVDILISTSFSNYSSLNSSFILDQSKEPNYNSPNLNFIEIKKFYKLLDGLSIKLPLFNLLLSALHSLRYPPGELSFKNINFILIILECPSIYQSISGINPSTQFKNLSFDILKRIFGLISNLDVKSHQILCHWWSRLPLNELQIKVNLFNLYITFNLNRLVNQLDHQNLPLEPISEDKDSCLKDLLNTTNLLKDLGFRSKSVKKSNKISISQYNDDWFIKSVCKCMSILFLSNRNRLKISNFYNNLIDFINVKEDFDVWQFTKMQKMNELIPNDENLTLEVLRMNSNSNYLNPNFTFCSYPFLISLGSKISILEYEARKSMGQIAELAFLSSIAENGKKKKDIFFNMRVRRSHLTLDSIMQIQKNPKDVKKSLKVEFINEQGIDGGGLKKEWFLLISKELFDPKTGLFNYDNESGLAFFPISKHDPNQLKFYFLVGVIVGMAIYNSMILDIKFPLLVYNKLMDQKLTIDDFIQIEPTTGGQLKKLLKTTNVEKYDIYFELTYKNSQGVIHSKELINNGSQIIVNDENKFDYVSKYISFYLVDSIKEKFNQFYNGFKLVMNSNSISLFTPQEIQIILVGDECNEKIDIDTLKEITIYKNCSSNDKLIQWFWKFFNEMTIIDQRKMLRFITGLDKLPSTGLTNFIFKISIDSTTKNRLPISHTCFNEICLSDWENEMVLREKIKLAINESNGFDLR